MPRKDANWIGFQASDEEKQLLEDYCYLKRLTKTEVLRSLIRDLRAEEGENSHHIIKLQLGKTESQILEDYCSEQKMTPTSVLRGLIQGLKPKETIAMLPITIGKIPFVDRITCDTNQDNWGDKKWEGNDKTTATHDKQEIREWLESLGAQADQEMADAASLRSMAQQMLAIAERWES